MTTQLSEPATRTWQSDPYTDALRTGKGPLYLRRRDGWLLPLEIERWCAEPDAADETVLSRCTGPVLDIGCGPGRLVATLARRGHTALGVDVTPEAVARTLRAGGKAVCQSVFDPLPREGRWGTVLLIDGNIGIGGRPAALLHRAAQLTASGGSLLVEVATAQVDERVEVHVEDGNGERGASFLWARLGTRALITQAGDAGWAPYGTWHEAGRHFVHLAR
ncbi:bifunctional 2-polyprenyl-6-hydroxyphenol methylase/3-demethylubiquinol 3-O-methyltransferase UbiG [Streptomyces sp. AP-93]|uniref:class I SAM-dependent methyltransferase n=1 Tax=Streptomyces sp. AP-93 TaxID=2929048 RepID=UPI001FB035A9|nr:class I SAM-dependent methyltransferase [Streptomyces sp. AP-93]MCJ0872650.1 methyltransferase domain-containing protein [Streptomyces sp. AP-93]